MKFDQPTNIQVELNNISIVSLGGNAIDVYRVILTWNSFSDNTYSTKVSQGYEVLDVFNSTSFSINYKLYSPISLPAFTRITLTIELDHDLRDDAYVEVDWDNKGTITYFVENIFEDSITKATKFIDVGEQIIKSNTNNLIPNLDAPRFKSLFSERNINLFDLYATSGLYIRGFDNQKYIAKWKDWLETLRNAFNFDYQLYNDTIFIGHYIDFYQDIEIASFEFQVDTDSYEISTNEKIKKSNVRLEYEKYEDDETNTLDSIHTESNNVVINNLLENSELDLTIPYIADAYKIEYTRRESFTKDVSKSTPNDNDLYMIDTFDNNGILTNRANEGFDVSNLYSPNTSYNLKLSQKRILIDYFTERLAEISQYSYNTPKLKNVFYKNNSSATIEPTTYNYCRHIKTIEGDNIRQSDLLTPIITGKVYSFNLAKRMKFNKYMKLIDDIMNIKGYITINGHENTIKLFVQELKYDWTNELLTIKGEEKHEQL